jgi:hypothetical protein
LVDWSEKNTARDEDVYRDEEGRGSTALEKGRGSGMIGHTEESTSDQMQNDGQSYQLGVPPLQLFTSTVPRRGGRDAVSVCQMVGAVHGKEHPRQRWWCDGRAVETQQDEKANRGRQGKRCRSHMSNTTRLVDGGEE